ncbi:MAG: ABC transporter ATP-binding protein [Planctomycetota bacterium]|jgi:ABC-type multidrug transport system ATPase subunit
MHDTRIAIRARGLSKVLGGRMVLRGVDVDVADGESVALTGANGAGKTTLLRCLASALRPGAGEVRWFGRRAGADADARRLVGLLAHESRLYPHLSLRENLIFAARMCDVADPARCADRWLRDVRLARHAHHLPTQISKGMRQRVAVARALVHDPRILLLDEPFCGLDGQGTDWLARLLAEQRGRGKTLCFTMHDPREASCLADRVFRLRSGRLEEVALDDQAVSAESQSSARAA